MAGDIGNYVYRLSTCKNLDPTKHCHTNRLDNKSEHCLHDCKDDGFCEDCGVTVTLHRNWEPCKK